MPSIEEIDQAIHHLDEEFTHEKEAEEAFRTMVLRDLGQLVTRVPTKAKSATYDLVLRTVRVFAFTWIAAFVPLVSGLGAFPNWDTWKSVGWSALVAAMAAALKVVQAAATKGEQPFIGRGV